MCTVNLFSVDFARGPVADRNGCTCHTRPISKNAVVRVGITVPLKYMSRLKGPREGDPTWVWGIRRLPVIDTRSILDTQERDLMVGKFLGYVSGVHSASEHLPSSIDDCSWIRIVADIV
jgi:hypothetical protein